jgi:hypothetical protein
VLYKPNYCCNCGEKIERLEWGFTHSRRFCDVCQTEFLVQDWTPAAFIALMAVVGLFGFGAMLRGTNAAPEAPQRRANSSAPARTANRPSAGPVGSETGSNTRRSANIANRPRQVLSEPERAKDDTAACGAPTKKGTPCTRRVKGGGRCWQHKD